MGPAMPRDAPLMEIPQTWAGMLACRPSKLEEGMINVITGLPVGDLISCIGRVVLNQALSRL